MSGEKMKIEKIKIDEYPVFFENYGRSINAKDGFEVQNKLACCCNHCGQIFTKEALSLLMMRKMMPNATFAFIGGIGVGDALVSGKCPKCGDQMMKIVIDED